MQEASPGIRLFVCSTFSDMSSERDELMKRVLPGLQARCERAGIGWGEVDLRWGVPDTEIDAGRTLSICFEEILRSLPFFVALIGHRYGSVVEGHSAELIQEHPWLHGLGARSITELELRCAMQGLQPGQPGLLILFRQDARESEEPAWSREKLSELKRELASGPWPVLHYREPTELNELLLRAYGPMIDQLAERVRSSRKSTAFEAPAWLMAAHRRDYVQRPTHEAVLRRIKSGTTFVCGESGSGKTALLSWLVASAREQGRKRWFQRGASHEAVLAYFAGATEKSSLRDLSQQLLAQAEQSLGTPGASQTPPELGPALANALSRLGAAGGALVIVDGVATLELEPGQRALDWIPDPVPERVQIVLSCTRREYEAFQEAGARGVLHEVSALSMAERIQLIQRYLARFGKRIEPGLADSISASPEAAWPGHLRLVLDELRLLERPTELTVRAERYATLQRRRLLETIVDRWRTDYERERPELVLDTLYLLACSRRGLSHSELACLLGGTADPLPSRVFWPFYTAMRGILIERGVTIDIASADVLALLGERADAAERRRSACDRIAELFACQPLGRRVLEELPWVLIALSRWEALHARLVDHEFLVMAWAAQPAHVLHYWRALEASTAHRAVSSYRAVRATEPQRAVIAEIIWRLGHPTDALAIWQPSAAFGPPDDSDALEHVHAYALLLAAAGRWEDAVPYFERIEASTEAPDALRLSALSNLASAAFQSEQYPRATGLHARELQIARALGDIVAERRSIANLALVHAREGRRAEALRTLRNIGRQCRAAGDLAAAASCLANEAALLAEQADASASIERSRAASQLARAIGDRRMLFRCSLAMAGQQLKRGLFDAAMTVAAELDLLAASLEDRTALARTTLLRARVYAGLGQVEQARALIARARELNAAEPDAAATREISQLEATLSPSRA